MSEAGADFDAFARAHGDALLRLAYVLCHEHARAEDLVQEALLKLYRRWIHHGPPGEPMSYARTIVMREYLGWRRRLPSREVMGLGVDDSNDGIEASAEQRYVERDAVWTLMSQLSQRERAVLVLRYFDDLDDVSIAAALGCSRGTVRSLASRALTRLRIATNSPASVSLHTKE